MFLHRYKKVFSLLLGLFVLIPALVFALNTVATGFQVSSTPASIDAHGVCQKVNATDGKTYFVPTNTSTEWSAFRANKPSGIVLAPCSGFVDYTIPGIYSFNVPAYRTLTVEVWGAGGGGGGACYGNGSPGAQSSVGTDLFAYGGGAGLEGCFNSGLVSQGEGGSAVGGTINVVGGRGVPRGSPCNVYGALMSKGGDAPYGGIGGEPGSWATGGGRIGGAPGGGGGGGYWCGMGGGGGSGGYARIVYTPDSLAPGSVLSVTVGSGGTGGPSAFNSSGGSGGDGRVFISWE